MRVFAAAALLALLSGDARCADTILVLPFSNLSRNSSLDWIGESIAETIREALAGQGLLALGREEREEALRRLGVRPNARLTRASVVKAGEALDASHVVSGQYDVTLADKRTPVGRSTIRISSRIVELKSIRQSGELVELAALDDLASIETNLAWQTLRSLNPEGAPSAEEFRLSHPPLRIDAMESYVRGLLAETVEQKQRLFTQAARLDARFSLPAFHLGRLYVDRKEYRFAVTWLDRVPPAHSRYHEARFLLGLARYYTGDYAGAEASFRQVAESVPLNEVYNNLAAAQSRRGSAEALENIRRALEGDSADPDYHFNLGYMLWKRSQFGPAAESFRAALDRRPGDGEAILLLGRSISNAGPRPGDTRGEGLERIKLNYEETVYRQLKAELETRKK